MKYSLVLLLLSAFFNNSFAVEFEFGEKKYNVEMFGNKFFIHPQTIIMVPRDIGSLAQNDCVLLEQTISKEAINYQSCKDNPETPYCRALKHGLIFRSKEENFQDPVMLYPVFRTWTFSHRSTIDDETGIREFAAKLLNADVTKIEFYSNPKINLEGPPTIEFGDMSLLSHVTKLVPLEQGALNPPQIKQGKLMANNRFFACDIKHQRISVSGNAKIEFSYTESIDSHDLNALWQIYEKIQRYINSSHLISQPNLAKALLIGRELERMYQDSELDKNKYMYENLMNDFFILQDCIIQLKNYDNKYDFQQRRYPEESFARQVQVEWRT